MTTTVNGTPRSTRARFALLLEGPAEAAVIHGLRRLLKRLQPHGFRCIDARQVDHHNNIRAHADDGDRGKQ